MGPNISGFSSGHFYPSYGVNAALVIVLLVAAVVGAIILQATFLSSRNEGRFTGFAGWLYNFLTFRIGILRGLLQFLYLLLVLVQLALALIMMFSGQIVAGLITLVVMQIALRLFYEIALLFINLCYNVMDINRKLAPKQPPAAGGNEPPKPEF